MTSLTVDISLSVLRIGDRIKVGKNYVIDQSNVSHTQRYMPNSLIHSHSQLSVT